MADHGASVTCPSCGKGLRWRAELAGRKVKCGCGHIFAMSAEAGGTSAAPPKAPPLRPAAAPAPTALDDSAFELDVPPVKPATPAKAAGGASAGSVCPSCAAPMKPGAVLCIQCGHNTATGAKAAAGMAMAATGSAAPAPRGRSRLGADEEQDHRFTELYLPIAMIVLGVLFTVVRAYSGMGSLTAADVAVEDDTSFNPLFGPYEPSGDDEMFGDDGWAEEGDDAGENEPDPAKDDAKGKDAGEKDARSPAEKDADSAKDSAGQKDAKVEPEKDAKTPAPVKDGNEAGDGELEEDVAPRPRGPVRKNIVVTPPAEKSFSVSPLVVAGFSLVFQVIIMVPLVFVCVLFVAKYVDVSFGSLSSVLLKITAIVLGPMALADWIDDMLLQATMGFGAMLGWSIRIVLVGASVIKLFDLDFFEAAVLLIVIGFVRFMLGFLLIFAIMRLFM